MRDKLIIGRSIDTGSWIHGLDPRAKLAAMLLYVAVIVMVSSWPGMVLTALFSILIMYSTRISFRYYLKAMKPLRFLMVFIFVIQVLTVKSGEALLSLGSFTLFSGGLEVGLLSVMRMALLVSFTAILTFTTTPGKLNLGLEGVLKPLKKVGVHPERLSLMISIALRFIPTILDETHKILKAQASRGADLKELPWKDKAKMLVALLVPVTVSAFRRAQDLIHSMESRGFVMNEPRTSLHSLSWAARDTGFLMLFVMLGATILLV
ncbi:energy-coupling factor transporter transmembrane protein EcfT [Paenibacillus sp. N3/727]|uniref:energy-coupling factor transporter transmembrane component T family protein n=1 Tax=Paenibacillus sp. N3/727 TaxID=2925845 RepID=UPI001F5310D6|nr:energy-coupling factor transporter transmembrane component T [Paenibacillus sp. N3/727]UNK19085.1 energy-coupling factor transporter transmembrane protein EcfT [Paenibacillus sp. N3/727]